MALQPSLSRRRLVLVGAGHAHVEVLRAWRPASAPNVDLVLVSSGRYAPYSGMVPGWLAGRYAFRELCIDVQPLCAAAGATLVIDQMLALDPDRNHLTLRDGGRLGYELLSLDVGSTLHPPVLPQGEVLAMRPLMTLRDRWEAWLAQWQHRPTARDPIRLVSVGAGAAGVETVLAVCARLRALRPDLSIEARLVGRSASLLPTLPPAAASAAFKALRGSAIDVRLATSWPDAGADPVEQVDLLLWAAGAQAHDWQRDPGRRGRLAVDEDGYIRVDPDLRSVSHPQVLAAGDCAAWLPALPKAGVFAVRMGPVLAHNLQVLCGGGHLRDYVPQRHALVILDTSDGRAIAARGPWSAHGRWVRRWKEWVDRRFLRKYGFPPEDAPSD